MKHSARKLTLLWIFSVVALCGYAQTDSTVIDPSSTLVVAENQEAELAYNKGLELFSQKKYSDAIDKFNEAISFKKDFAKAYYNRGLSYIELGQNDKAVEDFK